MELIRDILVSLSAIAVVVIGAFGLSTWKSELKGRARFDVVKNIMSIVLRLRGDFEFARSPLTSSVEYADRKQQQDESPNKATALNLWYAKNRRLKPLTENLQKLIEAGWETSVILDDEAAKKVQESIAIFRNSYGDLASAVDELCSAKLDIADEKTTYEKQEKWIREMEVIVSSRSNDDFSKKINTTVEELDLALRKYVK